MLKEAAQHETVKDDVKDEPANDNEPCNGVSGQKEENGKGSPDKNIPTEEVSEMDVGKEDKKLTEEPAEKSVEGGKLEEEEEVEEEQIYVKYKV